MNLLPILLVAILFRAFLYEPFRLPSGAMLPTFKVGSHVIVEKFGFGNYQTFGITLMKVKPFKQLDRGDVIVFEYPLNKSLTYIKRVIGMPGDIIEYKNKRLTVNNIPIPSAVIEESDELVIIEEHFEKNIFRVQNNKFRPSQARAFTVPENYYFVMGDNRDDSQDSRYWGFLPARNILGKVVYTIEPSEE
jgi:signal peptidase I